MPIDTSMYQTKAPADPFGGLGGAVALANGVQQNQILQTQNNALSQGLEADQAVGAAAQGSIRPDGTYDPVANRLAIAANPAAAYRAPAAIAATQQGQGANLTNQGAATGQAQGRMNDFYQSIGPQLAGNASPTRAQLMGTATDLLHQGRLLPADIVAINSEMPLDAKSVGSYAQNKFASTLSPGQQATPTTTGVDPNTGQPITGTAVGAFKQATSPTAPGGASAPGAAPAGKQGYTTSLPLGLPEQIKQNNDVFLADQANGATTMGGTRPLLNALPIIEKLNTSDFGPNSDAFARVKQNLITAGIIPANSTSANQTALREEANKYLHQNAGGFTRSDVDQNQKNISNPSTDLTQTSNLALIKNAIGMNRMDASIPSTFDAAHPGAPNKLGYLTHKSAFYQSHDPRAFSVDLMNSDEKAALAKSIGTRTFDAKGNPTNPAYEKFNNSVLAAQQAGVYSSPQGGQ